MADDYLQKCKSEKKEVKIFLSNGVMLQGLITAVENDSIVVDKCLVFKRYIISIDQVKR